MSETSLESLPRPTVKLVGRDGNVFAILGVTVKTLKRSGWTDKQTDAFFQEAVQGNYDHVLRTVMKYADVE